MVARTRLIFKKSLIGYLVMATLVLGFFSAIPVSESAAMFLPSNVTSAERSADLAKIQPALESKIIRQRMADLGLNQSEIGARMATLSDSELHQVASQIDTLNAGGDALGVVVVLLVIAILVVVLLQLTGHKVVVTK